MLEAFSYEAMGGAYPETPQLSKVSGDIHLTVIPLWSAAKLAAGVHGPLDPVEAQRIRRKIDIHILPMMCTKIQFMDKTMLGSTAILGIDVAAHLSTNQLGTIFYLSYLLFEYPQNLALQRFPVGKWMSLNIFTWGVALCCHAACTSFGGLFVVHMILGICEGSITARFLIISSMFYTRNEQTLQVGYWSQIISGFLSFGALHIKTLGFEPWQWLMVITGSMTLIIATFFWLFFPDSPTNVWFLTMDKRAKAVQRIKENQTGVENKHFKKEQFVEALTDPKTWLFAPFSMLDNIVTIWTGVQLASRITNGRAYIGAVYFLPSLLGVFLITLLPWSDKVGLLFGQWTTGSTGVSTTGFVLSLSWLSTVTAGHTKCVTVNVIMLSAYCVGIPWIIIGICYITCPIILLVILFLLARENKRRDAEPLDDMYDEVYIETDDVDGNKTKQKVPKEYQDLTDIENREFRYVL
ncbi:MFS general substrate transporter [Athelia psychrophila]|uniref:MFS general substrate transporter n=1 Tax=Athelia psychrophila TaxID=1759441 RepID=A0A167X8V6_9AGAM|nr:MFS general substrate transporter [Fibularhizoctonia sp. CBS 109695]